MKNKIMMFIAKFVRVSFSIKEKIPNLSIKIWRMGFNISFFWV